jgi:hypothetical protein
MLGSHRVVNSAGRTPQLPRRKKRKTFKAVSAVKALARERIGAPRPQAVVPDRKKKERTSQKYKPTFGELLQDES